MLGIVLCLGLSYVSTFLRIFCNTCRAMIQTNGYKKIHGINTGNGKAVLVVLNPVLPSNC